MTVEERISIDYKYWLPIIGTVAVAAWTVAQNWGSDMQKAIAVQDEVRRVKIEIEKSSMEDREARDKFEKRIWDLMNEREKQVTLMYNGFSKQIDDLNRGQDQIRDYIWNSRDPSLKSEGHAMFAPAILLISEDEPIEAPRRLIYDEELQQLRNEMETLSKLRDTMEAGEKKDIIDDQIWDRVLELERIKTKQLRCEFDDARRAKCWAEKLKRS